MKRVMFICHGNICRSTMAQFVFEDLAARAGFSVGTPDLTGNAGQDYDFWVGSAATSREEIGNPPFPKTLRKCEQEGVPTHQHYARQITTSDYRDWDCIIYMDCENVRGLERIFGSEGGRLFDPQNKFHLLLDFASKSYNRRGEDVADPWYTGNFDITFEDVTAGCEGLLASLQKV